MPYDQPQAMFDLVKRTILGTDVATGKVAITTAYATKGVSNVLSIKNILPTYPKQLCYLWAVRETCNDEEYSIIGTNLAVVKRYFLVGYYGTDGRVKDL